VLNMSRQWVNYKKVAKNGAINIPIKLRRELGIGTGTPMELHITEENELLIKPYQLRCMLCETTDEVANLHGKGICRNCCKKALERLGV
jgi:transcriptional pleiotropic regulator of transition state genes